MIYEGLESEVRNTKDRACRRDGLKANLEFKKICLTCYNQVTCYNLVIYKPLFPPTKKKMCSMQGEKLLLQTKYENGTAVV